MKDALGDRMKSNYEDRARYFLPRRSYTIIRIDGKAFHTYTRGCTKPFDEGLMEDMQATTKALCEQIQGCKFGYTQSDEISLVLTDFDELNTSAWFDGNIQKIASVSASIATATFNRLRYVRYMYSSEIPFSERILAHFDARVFTIPSRSEVLNYLLWRQNDASKNSISMVALAHASHNELEGKNSKEKQEIIFQKSGKNWNDLPVHHKRGSCVYKSYLDGAPIIGSICITKVLGWKIDNNAPRFNENWSWFDDKIPVLQ